MKRIILLCVASGCTLCGLAQNSGSLYLRNDSLANRIATDIAQDERYKPVPEVSLEAAIKDAFGADQQLSYWKQKGVSYRLKRKQQALLTEWNELKAQLDTLRNEETRLKASLSPTAQNVLASLRENCEKAQKESIRMQGVIDSLNKELADKTKTWEKFEKSTDYRAFMDEQFVKDVDLVADSLCNLQFSEMNIEVMKDSVVRRFDESRESIKSLMEPESFAELSKKVEKIKKYIHLCELWQKAINQMAGKFNYTINLEIKDSLEAISRSLSLSRDQNKEYEAIHYALKFQLNASYSLRYIIDQAINRGGRVNDIINQSHSKLDYLVRTDLIRDTDGKTIYNRYYIHFNEVLNELRTTTKTGRDLVKHLNELKDSL